MLDGMARILVIDDEKPLRVYIARRLVRDGHAVETVASGDEASALLDELNPDLVVVDWRLAQGENGIDVYEALHARAPDLEGLLITGYPGREVREAVARARLNGPLEKPFDLETLAKRVIQILDGRH